MNYDELISEIQILSAADDGVQSLINLLINWKIEETDVNQLVDLVESFFGNSSISSTEIHNSVYKLWSDYKTESIASINVMTMNERLYHFGLFDQFDSCNSEIERRVIYKKLSAVL